MTTIELPKLPEGKIFEEFLAAYFQARGLYVVRNIIDRQEEEVLEIDFITTEYKNNSLPISNLFEVKSGKWGFSEIFKIRGWLDYLNFKNGQLLVKSANKKNEQIDFYKKIAKQIDISIVVIEDLDKTAECLSDFLEPHEINQTDINIWRFSYWVERNILSLLNHKKKSVQNKKCYHALDKYISLINSGIFFTRNNVEKAKQLYSIFTEYPNISAKMGHELEGQNFDEDHMRIPGFLYREAYYKKKLNDIAISTFIEHRAILAILKSAIDYKIFKKTGNKDIKIVEPKGFDFESSYLELLPQSFKNGLEEISTHDYYYLYPVFWQWFLWVFGGFILNDYKDAEYDLLSKKSGIPVEEIPNALNSYDLLFPLNNGDKWLFEIKKSNISILKMFPVPFSGIGANYRGWIHTETGKYEDLKVTGSHTLDDLRGWNNVTVVLLNKNF